MELSMRSHELMFGLSHGARCKIVTMLGSGSKRHLELCNNLDISPPEVTRHCNILVNLGIIGKDSKSQYRLTGMGKYILDIVGDMEFLNANRTFFNEHDFDMIPGELDTISILGNAHIVEGPMNVLDRFLSINNSALRGINCIFEETIDLVVIEHGGQLRKGLNINVLIKAGCRIPVEYIENNSLSLEIREIPEIPLGMVISESMAMIIPRHRRGILDYGFGFTGRDEFLEYCNSIFSFYWSRSKYIPL